jgi:hypothetical protein
MGFKKDETQRPFIEIHNAFKKGYDYFIDEFDLRDKIQKWIPRRDGENDSIFVQVFRKGAQAEEQLEQLMIEDGAETEVTMLQKRINSFIKSNVVDKQIKELRFISDAGLPRDIASGLDIDGRKVLEKLFPILQKYQGLCFKKKPTTMRRMLIFPNKTNYLQYMLDMKKLMNEVNGKNFDELKSRVMIRFKGKYVLRIDRDIYEAFRDLITNTIADKKLGKNELYQINRVDLHLFSSEETMSNLKECVKIIMDLLAVKQFKVDPKFSELSDEVQNEFPDVGRNFGLYPLKSHVGMEFIEFANKHINFKGKVHIRFEVKTQQLLINGTEVAKKAAEYRINEWYNFIYK